MIPRQVVVKTLALLRELNKHYTPEEAMKIWDNLANVIDNDDLKMEVFTAMLNGGHFGDKVIFKRWNNNGKKINAIKTVRFLTDLGLREAKEIVEGCETSESQPYQMARRISQNEDGTPKNIDHDRIISECNDADLEIDFL